MPLRTLYFQLFDGFQQGPRHLPSDIELSTITWPFESLRLNRNCTGGNCCVVLSIRTVFLRLEHNSRTIVNYSIIAIALYTTIYISACRRGMEKIIEVKPFFNITQHRPARFPTCCHISPNYCQKRDTTNPLLFTKLISHYCQTLNGYPRLFK